MSYKLSERGVARRDSGVAALRAVVVRRGRRRLVVRAIGVCCALCAVAGVSWMAQRPRGVVIEERPIVKVDSTPVAVPTALKGVEVVRTDPAILTVATARADLSGVVRLDDAGLQEALRAAGEPSGYVRIGNRVTVEGEGAGGM